MIKSKSNIDNRRIAKNTIYLYIRMFLMLGISLYTARVIIRTLGIDDYGIYNIIGGVVVLFSFITNSLRSAFQRFISYELGRKESGDVHSIFGSSINIIILFSIIFIILSETLGLWFVSNKLNIPSDRYNAALWIYQFSVITFVINLFQSPFQAAVVSYEKFSFYAVYSIVDAILKLLIAFLIVNFKGDKLIFYGALISVVSIINLFAIGVFTKRCLKIALCLKSNIATFKSIFSYSGWVMINSSTVIIAQQGGNILLNLFKGVLANGAYGVANQISMALNGFVANFQSAFNPQIVKSYASHQYNDMFKLINRSCLFSFYLLFIMTIPFFINCDYLIQLWLGETPPYTAGFCQLMLIYFLIDASQAPLWMLIGATGKVKAYQIWTGIITLMNLPISGLLLYYGYSVYWVFIIRVIMNIFCSVYRMYYLKCIIPEFSIMNYTRECLLPIVSIIASIIVIAWTINIFAGTIVILNISLITVLSIITIWEIGIKTNEKKGIINLIKKRVS